MHGPEQEEPSNDDTAVEPRAGRCAIMGRPNVGKSTLLNALLKQKLAIATPRPGTTRSCILGVYASDEPPTQIAFVDTPGVGHTKTALHRVLVEEAKSGLTDVDVVVFMCDVSGADKSEGSLPKRDKPALEAAIATGKPVVLALNKVDRVRRKQALLPLLQGYGEAYDFAAVVPISASKRSNLDSLIREIRAHLPVGVMYDDEFLTDRPERFFVAELIREAAIRNTRDEIPYGVAITFDSYEDEPTITRIHATVVVEKESHKAIVIGKQGSMAKTIGSEARAAIEKFIGRKVFLKLWVKVVPGWTKDPRKVRTFTEEIGQ